MTWTRHGAPLSCCLWLQHGAAGAGSAAASWRDGTKIKDRARRDGVIAQGMRLDAYAALRAKAGRSIDTAANGGIPADKVAALIARALDAEKPKLRRAHTRLCPQLHAGPPLSHRLQAPVLKLAHSEVPAASSDCPSLRAKRKTNTRTEFSQFDPLLTLARLAAAARRRTEISPVG